MSKTKADVLRQVKELGLLAVIRGATAESTLATVAALVAGGVTGIEITYSTPNAAAVVKELYQQFGDSILLGMGTLTDPKQAEEASQAGAQFIVSPHYDEELGRAMIATGLGVMIGAFTPTEVFRAYRLGSDVVKIFPGSVGGPDYLKTLRGPFPYIPMMPTGGVTEENIPEWFAAGAVAVGAGSNLCPANWVKEGRFDRITETAKQFVLAVQKAKK